MSKKNKKVEKEVQENRSFWNILWNDWIKSILIALVLALVIRIFILAPTLVVGPSMEPTLHDPSYNNRIQANIGSNFNSDRLIAERISVIFKKTPNKGDIVTFSEPTSVYYTTEGFWNKAKAYLTQRKDYIKRVIATGGDTVKFYGEKISLGGIEISDYDIKDNMLFVNGTRVTGNTSLLIKNAQVYVNNQPVDESYLTKNYDIYVSIVDGVIDTSTGVSCDVNIDITVPDGYVYVMGDNRKESYDSRKFTANTAKEPVTGKESPYKAVASRNGCIAVKEITGNVVCRFWPLNRLGIVK